MKNKKILWLIIAIGLVILLLTSCQKEQQIPVEVTHSMTDGKGSYLGIVSEREYLVKGGDFRSPVHSNETDLQVLRPTVKTFLYTKSNIEYRVFIFGSGVNEGGIFVVNETKNKLEMDYYKMRLGILEE